MAKFREIDEAEWQQWISERPAIIQDMAGRIRPDTLYQLKQTGQRVYPKSFSEGGTVTVIVPGEFNLLPFDIEVFGLSPDDLEECELPSYCVERNGG